MARSRKHRRSRRKSRKASHHNPPKKHRRSRRYHRNGPGMWKDLGTVIVAGAISYVAARKATQLAQNYLPAMIPWGDVVAPALVAGAAYWGAKKYASNPTTRATIQAIAVIPLVEALVNRTGYGPMLGTSRTLAMSAPTSSGAPLSLAAQLALGANLEANLESDADQYAADY